MFRLIYWLTIVSCFAKNAGAQLQNTQWHFGNRAAISFISGQPTAVLGSNMTSIEGVASVCDPSTGDLLFDSNGLEIWNRNNQLMPNGTGLLGGANTSSSQGVVIVPKPQNSNQFYVFTTDEALGGGLNGFRYSVVDMTLDNNLGDVLSSEKNVLIQNNTTERLTVCPKGDGSGYWILIHERNNSIFKAFQLTTSGLNTNPVVNNIGSVHNADPTISLGDNIIGCMKFSPNHRKLAVALPLLQRIELFDFDPCTGILSNPENISLPDQPYGVEFSPDNTKLYVSFIYNQLPDGTIYQVNLSNSSFQGIPVGNSSSFNFQSVGSLQLGPDSLIYIAVNSENWLSAITQPNAQGIACGFVDQFITLGQSGLSPNTSIFGLPQAIYTLPNTQNGNEVTLSGNDTLCTDSVLNLNLEASGLLEDIQWNLNLNGITDTINNENPLVYSLPGNGIYTVEVIARQVCQSDTLLKSILVQPCVEDTFECSIEIPNVFSPNKDILNELFLSVPPCEGIPFDLVIYNRWGKLVFETTDITKGWNGQIAQELAPEGVYFYVVNYTLNGKMTSKNGVVHLLR